MMTPLQIKLIHVAKRQVSMDEPQYRLLLLNVGGVETCKDLSKHGFESVMAVFEDMGFRSNTPGHGPTFYRDRFKISKASPEMQHKIFELDAASRYSLPGLCLRCSNLRTDAVGELTPREAWNLIEMLKASIQRENEKAVFCGSTAAGDTDDLPF